jgi:hypothetical protein
MRKRRRACDQSGDPFHGPSFISRCSLYDYLRCFDLDCGRLQYGGSGRSTIVGLWSRSVGPPLPPNAADSTSQHSHLDAVDNMATPDPAHAQVVKADDTFELYDLRVEFICPPNEKTFCGAKNGDYFTLEGEMLKLPPGQGISIYSLGTDLRDLRQAWAY